MRNFQLLVACFKVSSLRYVHLSLLRCCMRFYIIVTVNKLKYLIENLFTGSLLLIVAIFVLSARLAAFLLVNAASRYSQFL